MTETLTVTNTEFFLALETGVREAMKQFESYALLPIAERALAELGIPPSTDEPEGYYHETEKLTRYFRAMRALQDEQNFTTAPNEAVATLHAVYTHPVFGMRKYRPTGIDPDPDNCYTPDLKPVLVSPVTDPITVACRTVWQREQKPRPWTIQNVVEAIPADLGTCLVGLATMADRKTPGNPACTACACETTVLSRAKEVARTVAIRPQKRIDWQVDKDVEDYGEEVVRLYNELIMAHQRGFCTPPVFTPEPANIEGYLEHAPDIRRCVNIAIDSQSAKPQYYHWAIALQHDPPGPDGVMSCILRPPQPTVVDFYRDRIVTTKEYQADPGKVLDPKLFS